MTRQWRVLCAVLGALVALAMATSAWATPQPPPPGHMLTVSEAGTGSGTVATADGAIACPPTCSHFYGSPAPVTITAAPAAGSTFSGWSGACSGSAATCTLSMTTNQSATATFTKLSSPPPSALNCRLQLSSTHVLLAAPKSKPAQRKKVGKLVLTFGCDQAVAATLSVTVVDRLPGVHHHHATFQLIRHLSLRAGHTRTFTLTLWRRALRGLKRHDHETITVSIQGSNASGSSGTGISALLKGVG